MTRRISVVLFLVAFLCVMSVPAFADGTVSSKYDVKIWGRVKVDLNYDTARFTKYNDFIGAVAQDADWKNDSTDFNPRDTRLGFEASHTDGGITGLARVEIDFYGADTGDAASTAGNNVLPRLRLGYVKMIKNDTDTSVLVGQDWIPVAQLNPNTVDFGILTAAGNLWWRVPQVTVRQKLGDVELLLSAMEHRRKDTASDQRMPWILARAAYDLSILGKGNYVALGGGYRTEDYSKSPATTAGTDLTRWLVVAELKMVQGPLMFQVEPWVGQGLDNEWLRYGLGVNPHTGTSRDPEAINAWGGFMDLTYALNEKTSFTVGYGIDNPKDDDVRGLTAADGVFTRNLQYFANAWYSVTKAIKVGVEFVELETERFQETNRGQRYTVSTFYNF